MVRPKSSVPKDSTATIGFEATALRGSANPTLRDTLLPKLLSGELSVGGAVTTTEAKACRQRAGRGGLNGKGCSNTSQVALINKFTMRQLWRFKLILLP